MKLIEPRNVFKLRIPNDINLGRAIKHTKEFIDKIYKKDFTYFIFYSKVYYTRFVKEVTAHTLCYIQDEELFYSKVQKKIVKDVPRLKIGKYKGQSYESVSKKNPRYISWLNNQSWFSKSKYLTK